MHCPLCRTRKARRTCPALRESICAVCCGTKRLTEIDCPRSCVHLTAARQHPPAVARRQMEQDAAILLPTVRHLSETQQQIFLVLQSVIAAYVPDGFVRLVDADAAEAAGSLAATLETAARGVIYEHAAAALPAQRLAKVIRLAIEELERRGTTIRPEDAAAALRAIEAGARQAAAGGGATDTTYLDAARRMIRASGIEPPAASGEPPGSSLIITPT